MKKERGRLKPAVLEEPQDSNASNTLNIQPGRVQMAWGNGQARSPGSGAV